MWNIASERVGYCGLESDLASYRGRACERASSRGLAFTSASFGGLAFKRAANRGLVPQLTRCSLLASEMKSLLFTILILLEFHEG